MPVRREARDPVALACHVRAGCGILADTHGDFACGTSTERGQDVGRLTDCDPQGEGEQQSIVHVFCYSHTMPGFGIIG